MQWATDTALLAGLIGMLLGVTSGAIIGIFFHREDWMGGYSSFRRRMTRLGHISFFGIGLLNILFALTIKAHPIPETAARVAAILFVAALATMSLCCFLTAWKKSPFRHFFFIPVGTSGTAIVLLLLNWNPS
jgi:hypothetical protein